MGKAFGVLGLIACGFPSAALRAFVTARLWLWFIVPLGVHPIGMWEAYGLGLFVSLFHVYRREPKPDDEKWWSHGAASLSASVALSLLCWGFGAIAHHYMGAV